MAFDPISTSELSVGKPITNELMEKFRSRDEYLNTQVGTLAAIEISNPSFEVTDTAAAGGVASWDFTAYTGGSGTVDTSTSVHGTQSIKITHPGGAGNGGGYYESDFYAVSTLSGYTVEYALNIKGGVAPRADIIRYNRNKSTIDEVILPGSTDAGATGVFDQYSGGFLPSSAITTKSSCAFIKLRLVGGTTDHSTAGTINFDHVRIKEYPNSSAGNYVIHHDPTVFTATTLSTNIYTLKATKPGGYKVTFDRSTAVATMRVAINGTILSTLTLTAADSAVAYTFQSTTSISAAGPLNGQTIQRVKPGDVITIGSTYSGIAYSNLRVGVKNPMYGGMFSNITSSTAST